MALTIKRLTGTGTDGYTEVSIPNGTKVLYSPETSYVTPIAAWTLSQGWIKTSTPPTGTSSYITTWLDGNTATAVDQSVMEELTIYLGENQGS